MQVSVLVHELIIVLWGKYKCKQVAQWATGTPNCSHKKDIPTLYVHARALDKGQTVKVLTVKVLTVKVLTVKVLTELL